MTAEQTPTPSVTASSGGLRRELKLTDAAAFSIGLIGPVGAMALLGVGAAGLLGPGATWAFIFAIVGVSLVAYGFIKLRSTSPTPALCTRWSAVRSVPVPGLSPDVHC
jgi:amino acid transporter